VRSRATYDPVDGTQEYPSEALYICRSGWVEVGEERGSESAALYSALLGSGWWIQRWSSTEEKSKRWQSARR